MLSPNSNPTPSSSPSSSESPADAALPAGNEPAAGKDSVAAEILEGDRVKINIRISEDKLSAFVSLHPPSGRIKGTLDADTITQELKSLGIGIDYMDQEAIQSLIDTWNKTHAVVEEKQVAEAKDPPLPGENARIEYLVDPNLKFASSEETGSIDFKNVNLIKPVKKGQPLARKHTSTKSAPGMDLFGQACIGVDGTDVELPLGTNTEVSPTDSLILIASVSGFLQQKAGLLLVNECFVVEGNVDYSTGNIIYENSALIKGDVTDGFTLNVGGALEIGGVVGEAKLIVGGDVLIKKGFVGTGQGLITAKGNINLGFSSNQIIRAHGDILLEKESFNCQMFSRKSISVFGPLVGGLTMAYTEMQCKIAGNDMGTKTELELGKDYVLHENKLALEEKLKELTSHLAKINFKLKAFKEIYRTRKRFSSSEAKILLQLRDVQEQVMARLPELEKRKVAIQEQIRLGYLREGIRLRVEKRVNAGVIIKVGAECQRIQESVPGPRVFLYQQGRIKVF